MICNHCKLSRMRESFNKEFNCKVLEIQINSKIKYLKNNYSEVCS